LSQIEQVDEYVNMKLHVLDQSANVSRNYLDLVVWEIKVGQRRQLQQFPRDSVEIVVLQMDGMKFGKSARRGNEELGTN